MDDAAVAGLYRRHVPPLRGFAYLLTGGDHALAEDLVHDAFIRTAGRMPSLRDPDAFEAYLRRSLINAFRSWQRRRVVERRWLARQSPMSQSQAQWQAQSQAQSIESVEADDEVVRRLRTLPPRQRLAVAARVCLDLSEAQTAELLGCSVGTIKSLTSRGLATLRKFEEVDVRP